MACQSEASAEDLLSPEGGPVIEVRFKDAAEVRGSTDSGLTTTGPNWLGEVQRLVDQTSATSAEPLAGGVSQEEASRLSDRAADISGSRTPDMASWYRFTLSAGTDVSRALEMVRSSPAVSCASLAPKAVPPPSTPDFSTSQLHLDPSPVGTDAEWAQANEPRARGAGIRVTDLEYYWTPNHEDLQLPPSADLGAPTYSQYTAFDDEHGTAVFGIIAAKDNGFGVIGGVPNVTMTGISPIETGFGYNPAGALTLLATKVKAGDVVLIEQQTPGPNSQLVPLEWEQASFDAIRNLSNLGAVVVETGGNGGQNLDDPIFGGKFNRSVRDSDAIIVGAGSSTSHEPMFYTSYGSRIDLQGYGENVVTTGGNHSFLQGSAPNEKTIRYTSDFNGTSSAGPVVVNAVVAIQSYLKAAGAGVWTADQIVDLLKQTGIPQGSPGSGQIGPLPLISEALFAADADAPVVQVSRVGDEISLSADDGWGWGLDRIEYRLNGGAWTDYSGPVNVAGIFEFEYRASDLKGNVGAPSLIQVTPRPPPPVTSLRLSLRAAAKVKAGKKLKVTASVKNTGETDLTGLSIVTVVPKKFAVKPGAVKVTPLDPGVSARRTIRISVKKGARAGAKLKVKVSVSAAGKVLASGNRITRIKKR